MKKYKKPLILIMLLFICYYISANWLQLQLIQGESMSPSYKNWQLVLLNKNPTKFQTGDVITFYCPTLDSTLVKRIVACPGDTVLISDSTLFVNNYPSPYTVLNTPITYAGIAEKSFTLGPSQYFVLGDNYDESIDSRSPEVGCILEKNIRGTVFPQVPLTNS